MAWYISDGYTYRKDGVFYFQRRIPKDRLEHYRSPKIAFSLRTKSHPVALSRAAKAAEKLDEHWYHLRAARGELPGHHLLRQAPLQTIAASVTHGAMVGPEGTLRLSGAVSVYLRMKGKGRPVTFHRGITPPKAIRRSLSICLAQSAADLARPVWVDLMDSTCPNSTILSQSSTYRSTSRAC